MIRNKTKFLLMVAMGAVISAGGTAVAVASPREFPDDGKIRVRNVETGQVCEFDTREQANTFGAGIENPSDWELVDPPMALTAHTGDITERYATHDDDATGYPTAPVTAAEPAGLLVGDASGASDPLAANGATTTEQPPKKTRS